MYLKEVISTQNFFFQLGISKIKPIIYTSFYVFYRMVRGRDLLIQLTHRTLDTPSLYKVFFEELNIIKAEPFTTEHSPLRELTT